VAAFRKPTESLGKIAADQNDADAQNNYPRCLANGQGTERDNAEASWDYKLAADQDYVTARLNYVCRLPNMEGIEKDEAETARYCKMAAGQDNEDAQRAYGKCVEDGCEVPKDVTKALTSRAR
jgi:TPR repeat protein